MYACVPTRDVLSAPLLITNSTLGHGVAADLCLFGYCIRQLLEVGIKSRINVIKYVHHLNVK